MSALCPPENTVVAMFFVGTVSFKWEREINWNMDRAKCRTIPQLHPSDAKQHLLVLAWPSQSPE